MNIICLVKYVPNVDNFVYDYENNVLVRENVNLILNPDDACAVACALKLKAELTVKYKNADVHIEVVSMGPVSITEHIKDLLRIGVDKAVVISDKQYVGSDSYATSLIIGKYLESTNYDLILTGSHSLDGDTSHVPSQVAETLGLNQLSNITKIIHMDTNERHVAFEVRYANKIDTYRMKIPAVLSVSKESKYKLPFVRYADLNLNVDDKLYFIGNKELGLPENEIGIKGSLTKVKHTYTKEMHNKSSVFVKNDEVGIETVYQFLKEKGFV